MRHAVEVHGQPASPAMRGLGETRDASLEAARAACDTVSGRLGGAATRPRRVPLLRAVRPDAAARGAR